MWRRSTRPVGRGEASPWAARTVRRSWAAERLAGRGTGAVCRPRPDGNATLRRLRTPNEKGYNEMGYKVVVDFDLCESNAVCMGIAPEVFEVRDDDFLYVLQEHPSEELRPKVEEAVQRCPKQAISIEDE
jgi:ferredoxin